MIVYVDIDDTICRRPSNSDLDYSQAFPINERIHKINQLYDDGNMIIYWTARGTQTGKCWFQITLSQLHTWGCKFNELRMGKPVYDLFIDDKNINADTFFSNTN